MSLPDEFPAELYKFEKWIGRGSNGFVFAADDLEMQSKVAIKWLRVDEEEEDSAALIAREISIHSSINWHPNILELKRVMRNNIDVYLVLELFPRTLRTMNQICTTTSLMHRQRYAHQLLSGIGHLHSEGIIHRDIKPTNILCDDANRLVICDFGMARRLDDIELNPMSDYVTTRWYRAPEVCGSLYSGYDEKVDVWAIGCIMAEMLIGRALFPGETQLQVLEFVLALLGKPSEPTIDKMTNASAKDFYRKQEEAAATFHAVIVSNDEHEVDIIYKLLKFDPADRASISEALAHPFFHSMYPLQLTKQKGEWIWLDVGHV